MEKNVSGRGNEKFRELYINLPISYQSLDGEGNFLDVNPAWLATLGYKRKEVIGKSFKDFLVPKQADEFQKNFTEFKKQGSVSDVEYRIRHKKGHYLDISFEGSIGFTSDGRFKQTHCIFKDITDKKRIEEELLKEKEKAQTYLDVCGVMMVAIDDDGIVTMINKRGCEILGYQRQDIIGKGWTGNFIPKRFIKDVKKVLRQNIKSENPVEFFENPVLNKNGDERIIAWYNTTIKDKEGKVIGHLSSGEDITEKKQAEDEMRLHAQIMKNMSEGVYLVRSDDGSIVYANPMFEKMFGYGPGEIIGKHVSIVNAPNDFSPEIIAKKIMAEINKKGEWHGEIENIRKDGTRFWCYANVSTFDHPKFGKVLISIHADVTERNKTRLELNKRNKSLEAFNKIAVGRELMMIKLKKEIKDLKEKLNYHS